MKILSKYKHFLLLLLNCYLFKVNYGFFFIIKILLSINLQVQLYHSNVLWWNKDVYVQMYLAIVFCFIFLLQKMLTLNMLNCFKDY